MQEPEMATPSDYAIATASISLRIKTHSPDGELHDNHPWPTARRRLRNTMQQQLAESMEPHEILEAMVGIWNNVPVSHDDRARLAVLGLELVDRVTMLAVREGPTR